MLGITFNLEWKDPIPTDYSLCSECTGLIVGKMYVGYGFLNNQKLDAELKLCERCYLDMINGVDD